MDLYLHIGTEKTGTSVIQTYLKANRDKLLKQRILYPRSPGPASHVSLAVAAMLPERKTPLRSTLGVKTPEDVARFRTSFETEFQHEITDAAADVCILSNEHCSSRLITAEELHWLHDFLFQRFENIRVVIYIRRQDEFLLSSYPLP